MVELNYEAGTTTEHRLPLIVSTQAVQYPQSRPKGDLVLVLMLVLVLLLLR